jgi:CRP-like cAMP-binding protein
MPQDKQAILDALSRSHLFKSLDDAGKDDLTELASIENVVSGETIIEEGTEGDCFYVLLEGQVSVSSTTEGKSVHLSDLGRGAVLGEVALLTGEPRTATVRATRDCCLLKFSEPGINEILERYQKVKELLVRVLVHRAKDTVEKLSRDRTVS